MEGKNLSLKRRASLQNSLVFAAKSAVKTGQNIGSRNEYHKFWIRDPVLTTRTSLLSRRAYIHRTPRYANKRNIQTRFGDNIRKSFLITQQQHYHRSFSSCQSSFLLFKNYIQSFAMSHARLFSQNPPDYKDMLSGCATHACPLVPDQAFSAHPH